MVAFVKDPQVAADVFHAVCDRYSFPDPYSMYFVDVLTQLLELKEVSEYQRFFKLCGINAMVVKVPVPRQEEQHEEQSPD